MARIERIDGVHTVVGESPVWDPRTSSLWFIDIVGDTVHRLGPDGAVERWGLPASPGAVATTTDGRLALALEGDFRLLDPATGEFSAEVPAGMHPDERISEGKADRAGRLLAVSGHRGFRDPVGHIVRMEPDGSVTRLRDGIRMGNALCFSPDGATMYVGDSIAGLVTAFDYDGWGLSGERVVYSTAGEEYFPDGATVDADGNLWIVLLHSPWIVRISPEGRELDRLEMPTPNIASIAFGGPDLDVAYVTSIDPAGFPGAPADAPKHAGAEGGLLYRVTGLGVRGVPEVPVVAWAPRS